MTLKVSIQFAGQGAKKLVSEVLEIQKALAAVNKSDPAPVSDSFVALARALGVTYNEAKKLTAEIGLGNDVILRAVSRIKELNSVNVDAKQQFVTLKKELGLTSEQFDRLSKASGRVSENKGGLGTLVEGAGKLFLAYQGATLAIQQLQQAGAQAYDLLIGQNERLNQELLAAQSTLAATNKISLGGKEITDPTEAIKATSETLKDALEGVRKDSLALVGITSQQLTPLFQTLVGQASQLNNQSKQFSDPIKAAGKLTVSFAAALGTLQIPLDQANQEINSILTGTVDQNSILAKRLNIGNKEIAQYKAQGTLVDELSKRLQPFVAGNALAANSISGITSNLQEVLETVTRIAGEPLLEPIIDQLNVVYKFVQDNQDAIQQGAINAVSVLQAILNTVGSALQKIGVILQPIVLTLGDALGNTLSAGASSAEQALGAIANTAVVLVQALAPLLQIVASIAAVLAEQLNTPLGQVVLTGAALALGFGQVAAAATVLTPIITGLGASFAALSGVVSAGGFTALAGAIAQSTVAMGAFAAASAAALAPFIALGGAITLTLIVKQTQDLKNVNEQLESSRVLTDGLAEKSLSYAQRLKSLNDLQKANGKLTAEQTDQYNRLQKAALIQIQSNNEQIASLKEIKPASEEQRNAIEAQIGTLERMNQAISKQGGQISIAAKDLKDLGNTFTQLKEKAENAQRVLAQGAGGDSAKANEAAKELIDLTQQRVELGAIAQGEAIKQLQELRNNTKLSFEQQKAAAEAITKLTEAETKRRSEVEKTAQQQIQAQVAAGTLSQVESEKRITASKIAEAEIRLKATQAALARENKEGRGKGTKAQELAQQEKQIQAEIAKTRAEGAKAEQAERVKDFDEQQKLLESLLAQRQISEQEFNKRSLALAESRANEELKQIQAQRSKLASTDKQGLEALAAQEAEVRAKLAKARDDNRKKENETLLKNFDEQSKLLEAELAERNITEEQFNERSLAIAEARAAEELRQLAGQRRLLAATDKEGLEAIAAQEAEIRARVAKAREDALRKEIERRTRLIEEESGKAADAIAASETERLTRIQEIQNAGGDPQEIEGLKLQATRDRINAELQAEQQKLDQLRALPQPTDPKEVAARENTIRDQVQKTAQIRLQQLQNEGQQQELLRQFAIRQIEDQAQAQKIASDAAIRGVEQQKSAIEKQKAALDTVTQSLERQTKLTESQTKLQDAQNGLVAARGNAELASVNKAIELRQRLNQETDPKKRKAIEQALATLGVDRQAKELDLIKRRQAIEDKIALQQQAAEQAGFARAKANLEIELQRNEIAARRAVLEAQIAEQQAKQGLLSQQQSIREAESAVAKAQQTVDPRDDIAATAQLDAARDQAALAQQSVTLSEQNRQGAEQQLRDQSGLAQQAREALATQQQAQIVQSQSAETIRQITQSLELADAKAASIAGNLANAAGSAQQIGGGLGAMGAGTAIPARRMGGPVEAGQPYLVGEEGPEIVIPKGAGTVLTAKQTAALMAPMAIAPSLPAVTVNPTASIGQLKQATAVLQRIEKALTGRPTEGMQINFNNDPDPDLTIWKVMRSQLRAGR